jgi:hypothetical protein
MLSNESSGSPYSHNNEKLVELADVNNYTLEDYGLTVENVKSNHFGVDITDPRTGEHLPDPFYKSKIEAAVAQVEKDLDVVILPRALVEHHDFYRNDFNSHMYFHTHRKPIVQLENVRLEYGAYSVFNYPSRWWKVYNLPGHIQMLPTMMLSGDQSQLNLAQAYSGFPMITGTPNITNHNTGPQLFHIEYVAGMLPPKRRGVAQPWEMHPDLWQLIIKMALKEVFQQWGRLIIGPGIAGMSIDVDGVSQRIDTTQSAMYGGASAEIIQLDADIKGLKSSLKSYYGFNLGLI